MPISYRRIVYGLNRHFQIGTNKQSGTNFGLQFLTEIWPIVNLCLVWLLNSPGGQNDVTTVPKFKISTYQDQPLAYFRDGEQGN